MLTTKRILAEAKAVISRARADHISMNHGAFGRALDQIHDLLRLRAFDDSNRRYLGRLITERDAQTQRQQQRKHEHPEDHLGSRHNSSMRICSSRR